MESSLEVLAQKGKEGDRTVLEELIRRIQDGGGIRAFPEHAVSSGRC